MGFTEEQTRAIDARGKTIVSASAGSGKTTVMIEKIVRLVKSGVSVSEILAVTYTNKAAASMKEKLKKELVKAINAPETPFEDRKRLKTQLSEVSGADISTIHSFCANLIRSHFFTAGVESGFRVILDDDPEGKALKSKALDALFDEAYDEAEPAFMKLLSVYFRSKNDNQLREILDKAYTDLRIRADYRAFLERTAENYTEAKFDEIAETLFGMLKDKCAYYLSSLAEEAEYFEAADEADERNEVAAAARKGKAPKPHKPRAGVTLCREIKGFLSEILSAKDYFSACAIPVPKFSGKETARQEDSEERLERVKRLAALKERVNVIAKEDRAGIGERKEELAAYLRSGEIATALAEYVKKLDDKYGELKKAKGVLDCSDLEHYTLKLLSVPSVKAEIREKYKYVFIDEYQDVNPVQEEILCGVSGDEVFMVGDVKQSIYGFRGSESSFFMQKQAAFRAEAAANALELKNNFRSSDAVLTAVNTQFERAMTTANGSVDYKNDSYMVRGGLYEEHSGRVGVHFVQEEQAEKEEKEEQTGKKRGVYSVKEHVGDVEKTITAEAKLIRDIIERERKSRIYDVEKQCYRRVEYSDIAILTRWRKGKIKDVIDALSESGIPVTSASSVNVCDYPEIKTLIDIMQLIENPEQDIPLCSALLSIGFLTPDELAEIRLASEDKKESFRKSVKAYRENRHDLIAHKLKKFDGYFREIRTLANVVDVGTVLTKIITDTKMESALLARENGAWCLKRIHRFLEEATNPEPLTVRDFLERLADLEFKVEYSENGGENSVRVLTMHASKGLEYPIVILSSLNEPFGGRGRSETVRIDDRYGLAPYAYDETDMSQRQTVLRKLAKEKKKRSELEDELNLYYVALTRAQYGLHLVFESETPTPDVRYARSFADFTDFSVWARYFDTETAYEKPYFERQAMSQPNEEQTQELMSSFNWRYAFGGYENLPVKRTATELVEAGVDFARKGSDEIVKLTLGSLDEDPFDSSRKTTTEREARLEEKGVSEERIRTGIAYHAALENFDFSTIFDGAGTRLSGESLKKTVEEFLEKFRACGKIPESDFALLQADKLVEILENDVFAEIVGMPLMREQQFIASLTANEVLELADRYGENGAAFAPSPQGNGEHVLFQGAIDLLAIGKDNARVIDYKYSSQGAEYLKEHYALQLALYRKITAKILRLPIEKVRCTIVNIRKGFSVEL